MSITAIMIWIVVVPVAAAAVFLAWNAHVTRRIARRARELVPAPGRFLTIDGHRIHYTEAGSGPPIVFVHGLGGTQFNFSHPLFERLSADYHVVSVDRPGSGFSTRRGGWPATPAEHAVFLTKFLEAKGIERPLIVGHSLGGAIALAMALDHADTIAGLALIAPLTHHNEEIPPEFAPLRIRSPLLRRLVANTLAVPASVKHRDATLAFVFGPQEPPEDYAIAGGAMASLVPGHFYATSTDFVAIGEEMKRQQERYAEIDMPVGILFGTADRVLDCDRHGRAMEGRIRDLDLELLEGVGHMPQYSEPEKVTAFIRRMAGKAFRKTHRVSAIRD